MNEERMSGLEIFELGIAPAKALGGDKETIADVEKIARMHPEMFESFQDVIHVIDVVVKNPEIVMKNPRPKGDKDFMAFKQLNEKKMGDVGIRNDNGTNVIFHVNKKRMKILEKMREMKKAGGDARTPHTPRPAGLGANVANANSALRQMVGTPNSHTQVQSLDGSAQKQISSVDFILPQNDLKIETKLKSIQKILDSRTSQAQKDKALKELEALEKRFLNENQKVAVKELESRHAEKGMKR